MRCGYPTIYHCVYTRTEERGWFCSKCDLPPSDEWEPPKPKKVDDEYPPVALCADHSAHVLVMVFAL
jgi:hypothetical protein